ncbi:MAG: GntR family transcriptional regulator [Syntrophomonadaceae bacterium]|nr:GntR family transcriptional regulator [Syntrophomonadaceae bacterium]
MLDRNSPIPLHVQFEQIVRNKIKDQDWHVNAAIPSENELSAKYGISRMTVRGVLNRLVFDGLLYRVPGKGTFVAEPKIISRPLSQMGIREQLETMGYKTSTQLLYVSIIIAPNWVTEKLEVPSNTPMYEIKRLRYLENSPFSIHTSFIPQAVCPNLESQDLVEMQLCDIQQNIYRQEIIRRVETLESVKATAEEAALLDTKRNSPLLLFENLVYTHGDKPIECARVLFKADKIKLRMEYSK